MLLLLIDQPFLKPHKSIKPNFEKNLEKMFLRPLLNAVIHDIWISIKGYSYFQGGKRIRKQFSFKDVPAQLTWVLRVVGLLGFYLPVEATSGSDVFLINRGHLDCKEIVEISFLVRMDLWI